MYALSRIKRHHFWKTLTQARLLTWTKTEDNILKTKEQLVYPQEDLFTFLTKQFQQYGERTAVIDAVTEKKFTFNELIVKSKQLASFFDQRGYKENDVAGIHVTNCIEYPVAFFGTIANGMTFTTANPVYNENELCYQFEISHPKILFSNSRLLELARKVADKTSIEMIISMDEPSLDDSGITYFYDAINMGSENFDKELTFDPKIQIAALPYSSGTTGLPKGVMVSHYNIATNVQQMINNLQIDQETYENILGVLPMYHIYALQVICCTYLSYGCTINYLSQFEPESFLSAIQRNKIEFLALVPPLFLFLLNHPLVQEYDLSSLKSVLIGAAPLDEKVANAFHQKFPNVTVMQGYGSTECLINCKQVGNVDYNPNFASVGPVFIDTEMKVVCQETGNALNFNETGEICLKGPQITLGTYLLKLPIDDVILHEWGQACPGMPKEAMKTLRSQKLKEGTISCHGKIMQYESEGYLNNQEATSQTFQEDGWVRTGDLGYYNENYEVFVVDRIKELIKYKGFQVPPAELEDLLLSHDEIVDSCVIGIPDDVAGELPRAYIVKAPHSELTEEEVCKFVEENAAPHKKIRGGVQFIDAIPKSASGKMLRRFLKEEYLRSI